MSTAVVAERPSDVTEPVDPPEVVREKAGVERTNALLAEYKEKVRSFRTRYRKIQSHVDELRPAFGPAVGTKAQLEVERTRLKKRHLPVIVAAERLARYASGLIENARIPQLDKIELQLRNAELEAELIEARHLIG